MLIDYDTVEEFNQENLRILDYVLKLKHIFIQEAVSGKLLPQNPNDEPASELLKAIDRNRLEKEVSKNFLQLPIDNSEEPYKLPLGWVWTRFGNIEFKSNTGLERNRDQQSEDNAYEYFKMNNIGIAGDCILEDKVRVNATDEEIKRNRLQNGDFLFNTRNSRELVGKTCVINSIENRTILFNNNILRTKFLGGIEPNWVNLWFCSNEATKIKQKLISSTTNVAAIYQNQLRNFLVPLSPLNEQKLIIKKINYLIGLCGEIQERINRNMNDSTMLIGTILNEAFNF